jgi:hypothetical protein
MTTLADVIRLNVIGLLNLEFGYFEKRIITGDK